MKYTLSVLVENEVGVLSRISGLFARRGYNIESLAVGATEQPDISRVTMVLAGDIRTIEQLIKQLYKLINIKNVTNVTNLPCIERELVLLKVRTNQTTRAELLEIANIFRAKVVDLANNSLTLEVTGDPGKMAAIEQLLTKFGLLEVARTGKISLVRESLVNTEVLRTRN